MKFNKKKALTRAQAPVFDINVGDEVVIRNDSYVFSPYDDFYERNKIEHFKENYYVPRLDYCTDIPENLAETREIGRVLHRFYDDVTGMEVYIVEFPLLIDSSFRKLRSVILSIYRDGIQLSKQKEG